MISLSNNSPTWKSQKKTLFFFWGGMFGETTILFLCKDVVHHPTETKTTTKNWMCQVPGLKTVAPCVESTSIATMHFWSCLIDAKPL